MGATAGPVISRGREADVSPLSARVLSKRPEAHSPMPARVRPHTASDRPVMSADLRTKESSATQQSSLRRIRHERTQPPAQAASQGPPTLRRSAACLRVCETGLAGLEWHGRSTKSTPLLRGMIAQFCPPQSHPSKIFRGTSTSSGWGSRMPHWWDGPRLATGPVVT